MRLPQRIYRSATTDSTRWSSFTHRPGDIFICTPPKCGTTWMQMIVASLLWPEGNFPGIVMHLGPWFDGLIYNFDEVLARLEAQTHRRYIKTHTPADGIPIFDTASYIVVARDGRDAFMSYANHMAHMRPDLIARLNAQAAAQGIDPVMEFHGDIHDFFERWITAGALMHHIASWWDLRHKPNVLFVHYNDLKVDLHHEMQRIADFLNTDVPAALWPEVVARCTFTRMRADAEKIGTFDRILQGGTQSFLFQGTNGRWQNVLVESELQIYQERVEEILSPAAAEWLEHGRLERTSPMI